MMSDGRPLHALLLASLFLGMPPVTAVSAAPARVETVTVETSDTEGRIDIRLATPVEPVMRWIAADSCWRLDLPETESGSPMPAVTAFRGPLRQVWQGQVHADPPVQRLNLYVAPGTGMKLTRTAGGLSIRLRADAGGAGSGRRADAGPLPESLLLPGHGGGAVVIDVKRSPVLPLLAELAGRAGISLRMRDDPPAIVTFRSRSESAMAALERLAKRIGMVLTHEGADWWLSSKKNPLLKLPAAGEVVPDTLQGVTVAEALRRLSGDGLARHLEKGVPAERLRMMAAALPDGLSPRAAAQHLRGDN